MGIVERKNREKQALRERILDASRRIMVREGFAALSMRKIADAIEYSPATLYLHFENRDEIAQALCAEGFAQLLGSLAPAAGIADPGERLKAIGRAYVAFGIAHPETYRLIFMEHPSYTGAAFNSAMPGGENESDAAALRLMTDAIDEMKAAGRLPSSTETLVWADALWATVHGIVSLRLTCPVFPNGPLDTVVDTALDAWFGSASASPSAAVEASEAAPAQDAQPQTAQEPQPPKPKRPAKRAPARQKPAAA